MVEQKGTKFVAPDKCVKNTPTNETVLTEHLLNVSGRLWTPKRTGKMPLQPSRMKEQRKKKRNQKKDWQSWWEAEGEWKSPHSNRFPHGGEISWEQKETFRGSKENTTDGLSKVGQSKNCVCGLCCSSAHPTLSCESCVLESGVWNADPGRGHLLSLKRQPVGKGLMGSKTGKVCGKCPRHHRSKASLLSGMQGARLPL